MLASRSCAQVFAALPVEHVLSQQGGGGSHRGVVAPGADLPVEPIRPLLFGVRMKAVERNRLPGSWPLPNQPPPVERDLRQGAQHRLAPLPLYLRGPACAAVPPMGLSRAGSASRRTRGRLRRGPRGSPPRTSRVHDLTTGTSEIDPSSPSSRSLVAGTMKR